MKGDAKVVEYLNKALRHELTAVNQYWLHYRLLDNWGYKDMATQWRKESIEEMEHADKLVVRIIFLEGFPNLQLLDPAWLYTAFTRAKRQVVLVGEVSMLADALARPWAADRRHVGLEWPPGH